MTVPAAAERGGVAPNMHNDRAGGLGGCRQELPRRTQCVARDCVDGEQCVVHPEALFARNRSFCEAIDLDTKWRIDQGDAEFFRAVQVEFDLLGVAMAHIERRVERPRMSSAYRTANVVLQTAFDAALAKGVSTRLVCARTVNCAKAHRTLLGCHSNHLAVFITARVSAWLLVAVRRYGHLGTCISRIPSRANVCGSTLYYSKPSSFRTRPFETQC